MNNKKLKKLQASQLDLALEVKRICEKYDIKYFLVDGTALGAVKYGGFIPWDDDLDIGMYRDDYYKFIKICKTELDKRFYIQNIYNSSDYGNCFSQLRIKGTICKQKIWDNKNEGIFIDIHPFIPIPDNKLVVIFLTCLFKFHKMCLLLKSGANIKNKLTPIIFLVNKLRSRRSILNSITKIFNKYQTKDTNFALKISGRHYDKDFIYINNLKKLKYIQFEDKSFPIMPDYDRMLSAVYGNYLLETPTKNTNNRHEITLLDFGNYSPRSQR